jgi:rare lipoprotein A (peptidoglycan hydrolase)
VTTIGAVILVAWSSFGAFAGDADKPLSTAQLRRIERQEARLAGYQVGKASWYGAELHGHRTASGQHFDRAALTAAHPTLPLNSAVRVTNLANGRSVTVKVNDRGPGVGGRVIDLSQGAAEQIGMRRKGVAMVIVEPLGDSRRIIND